MVFEGGEEECGKYITEISFALDNAYNFILSAI
jgi:hypothetical protein